jgi:uroporphyrinogen decarboxylase
MTPRQRAAAALRREKPEGLVPHLELEFQLSEELVGVPALRREHLEGVSGARRQDLLKRNAEHWVEVARRLDYSVITGTHWLDPEDQIETFHYLREIAGEAYMLSAFVDGTFSIPTGESMMDQAVYFIERREQALEDAHRMVEGAIAQGVQLIEGGAEVIFMCADYCFNDGPFLSPRMFAEFVTPFLKRQVDAFRAAGVFTIKHTDGDIMPILDQLVAAGPDGLHSLDPMAGVDIKQVREIVGQRLCLLGNVNLAYVQQGPPEKIVESARYCLQHGGVSAGAYIYTTSNCIFTGVPLENYELMLRVRDEDGRL